jgi:hypothetical protein
VGSMGKSLPGGAVATIAPVTKLMEKAIEKLRAIPEGEQDRLAEFVLHELTEDERWSKSRAGQVEKLGRLASDMKADDEKGLCGPFDGPLP